MPKVMLPLAAQPLWLPTENLAAGPWEPVCAPVRLASAAASVSFASIPAQYVMFRLRCQVNKDATPGSIVMTLNNDTGGNYARERLIGDNATVSSGRVTAQTSFSTSFSMDASTPAVCTYVVAKPIAGAAGLILTSIALTSTNLTLFELAGHWGNTADLINRIDILASAGNFDTGSIFILEGSKF